MNVEQTTEKDVTFLKIDGKIVAAYLHDKDVVLSFKFPELSPEKAQYKKDWMETVAYGFTSQEFAALAK